MKNKEDIEFLQSMKTDRVASFGSHDRKLASQLKRKEARIKKQEARRMKTEEEGKSPISSVGVITSSEGSSSEVECDSPFKIPQQTPVKAHRRETRTGTAAFIPGFHQSLLPFTGIQN